MTNRTIRWGIVSAGKISHDFCVALSTLPLDEHELIGVAARELERAKEFATKFDIPKAFGSYIELAQCAEIDVVYIGALNPQHFELGMLMLQHGKHILCEKPLCMNRKQAEKLIKYAEQKKLFLMEAVWSRFFPAYQYVRKQIDTDMLGEIQQVDVSFGFPLMNVERLQQKDMGGGCILDLGIYTIQLAQWVFQEPPQKIVAQGELNADGVDIEVKSTLHYSGGRFAKMHLSAKQMLPNTAVIQGTKGRIELVDFWCPTKVIDIDGKPKEWVLPKAKHVTNFRNSEGLRFEAEAVRQSILEKKVQNEHVSHNESLLLAQIEDEIRRQVGVIFAVDQ